MTVVDASVAVKWLFPEPGAAAARKLLESGERLSGPALVRIEVLAAVTRKARLAEISARDAVTGAELWLGSLQDDLLTLFPDEQDLAQAFRLSLELQQPLQDCLYLALAKLCVSAHLFSPLTRSLPGVPGRPIPKSICSPMNEFQIGRGRTGGVSRTIAD
jgi:predicted nucleic acid-binding protein